MGLSSDSFPDWCSRKDKEQTCFAAKILVIKTEAAFFVK